MYFNNEMVGKWFLLKVIFITIPSLFDIYMVLLLKNFTLREKCPYFYVKASYYSVIFIILSLFSRLPYYFDKYIIDNIFNRNLTDGMKLGYGIIYTVIVIGITSLLWKIINRRKYFLPLSISLLLLMLLATYIVNRGLGNYNFYPLIKEGFLNNIKILDVPVLGYSLLTFLLLFHSLFRINKQDLYKDYLLLDKPLGKIQDDEFKRSSVYSKLIETILDNRPSLDKAVSIGIVNSWGDGKTSFLKILKSDLEDKTKTDEYSDIVLVEFNPWFSANSTNVTLDFFQALDNAISEYLYTGSMLKNYAKRLTNVDTPYNPIKYLPDNWVSEQSNGDYFIRINELIKSLNRKIIIFIDDLDRLDHKEIYNVFQIIRNSGNFANMMFIIPFERDYILKSLVENKISNPGSYIKKFFDVEYTLPSISRDLLKIILQDSLLKTVNSSKPEFVAFNHFENQVGRIFTTSLEKSQHYNKYQIIQFLLLSEIKNKRDLKRFCNSLNLSFSVIRDFIYLPDLVLLELIKYIDSNIYHQLFQSQGFWYSVPSKIVNSRTKKELFVKEHTYKLSSQYDFTKERLDHYDFISKNEIESKSSLYLLIQVLFQEPELEEGCHYAFCYAENYTHYHRLEVNSLAHLIKKGKDNHEE